MDVLVAGATGRLAPVPRALLARGHGVRLMTRRPDADVAQALVALGARLLPGDFDDPASVKAAARGADAAFAGGTAHRAGPDGEARHGIGFAEAMAAARVPHVVYMSGAGAGGDSGLPLFAAKRAVEERIRALGLPATILAPVYFMENVFNPWNRAALEAGRMPTPIAPDMPLQQVAIADVANFTAIAVERPGELVGKRVELASDELTAVDAARALSRVLGRPVRADAAPPGDVGPGLRALFNWLERAGRPVDLPGLQARYPEVGWHSFETWARTQDWPAQSEQSPTTTTSVRSGS